MTTVERVSWLLVAAWLVAMLIFGGVCGCSTPIQDAAANPEGWREWCQEKCWDMDYVVAEIRIDGDGAGVCVCTPLRSCPAVVAAPEED